MLPSVGHGEPGRACQSTLWLASCVALARYVLGGDSCAHGYGAALKGFLTRHPTGLKSIQAAWLAVTIGGWRYEAMCPEPEMGQVAWCVTHLQMVRLVLASRFRTT